MLLDVRDVVGFKQFHLQDARLTPTDELGNQSELLRMEPANTVVVAMYSD